MFATDLYGPCTCQVKKNYSDESFDCVTNSEFATGLAMGSGSVFQEFLEQIFTYILCANIHTSTFGPYSLLIITHLSDSPVAEEKRGLLFYNCVIIPSKEGKHEQRLQIDFLEIRH